MPRKRGVVFPLYPSITIRSFTVPHPPPERQPSQIATKTIKVFSNSFGPLYTIWERLQVSHCGQYSVERMLALEEYGQRVSPFRVALVCAFTPLSPLLLVVLAAYLPLRPCAEGSSANFIFWIRHLFVLGFTLLNGLMQAKAWLSELPLTTLKMVGIAFCSALVTTIVNYLVATLWIFPVPFLNVLQIPIIPIVCTCITSLVANQGAIREIPDVKFRLQRYFMLIIAQSALIIIYPAYQALFGVAPSIIQPYLMALIMVVNIAMKNILAGCGAHLEDRLPEVIVFTVDVFSALYSALCMRNNKSLKMVGVVVSTNVIDMILALHGMNRRSRVALANRTIQERRHRQHKLSAKALGTTSIEETDEDSLGTLFQATLELLQLPGQLDPAELRQICLLSCAEHKVSDASKNLLAALAARCVYNNDRRPTRLESIGQRKSRYSSTAMSGPDLSAEHFLLAAKKPPKLMQRLRDAAKLIPEVGKRFSIQVGTRFGNSLGFRVDSKERLNSVKITGMDEDSDTDSFENDTTPSELGELASLPSRTDSYQTELSQSVSKTQIESNIRRMSENSGHFEPFSRRISRQNGSISRIGTQLGGSARKKSTQIRTGSSRRISAFAEPPISVQNGSNRKVLNHLGSSRRLAEFIAASTKFRPLIMHDSPVINDVLKETRKQNTIAVNQTLQLLFNNEYLGLIAYAQCITPMIYMTYMMIIQEMPNRVFYLNGHDLDHPEGLTQRFSVIAAFVGLQTGLLIGLHLFVATRFGVLTLYQVAFVLETHARLVQGKITTWLLFAVGFMLEHYGVDFSFKFDWIYKPPT